MERTTPARSALTVTPFTGVTEPIAETACSQSCCAATTVVTASGGGWKEEYCAMAACTCRNLTNPITPRNRMTVTTIRSIRFHMSVRLHHETASEHFGPAPEDGGGARRRGWQFVKAPILDRGGWYSPAPGALRGLRGEGVR